MTDELYPTMKLDRRLCDDLLDDPDLSAGQKEELMEILWAIAVACVDLKLGLHPLQQACGQFELYGQIPEMLPKDMVVSQDTRQLGMNADVSESGGDSSFCVNEQSMRNQTSEKRSNRETDT
ncbi:MAG: hypothetical protein AAF478_11265 [Pseudomonadota bacterium]